IDSSWRHAMTSRVDGTSPGPLYDDYNAAPDSDSYVVQSEKTLDEIAANLHVDRDALAEANPQIRDGKVLPLQVINIPNFPGAQKTEPEDPAQVARPSSGPPGPIGDGVDNIYWRGNVAAAGSSHSGPVQYSDPKGPHGQSTGLDKIQSGTYHAHADKVGGQA